MQQRRAAVLPLQDDPRATRDAGRRGPAGVVEYLRRSDTGWCRAVQWFMCVAQKRGVAHLLVLLVPHEGRGGREHAVALVLVPRLVVHPLAVYCAVDGTV